MDLPPAEACDAVRPTSLYARRLPCQREWPTREQLNNHPTSIKSLRQGAMVAPDMGYEAVTFYEKDEGKRLGKTS